MSAEEKTQTAGTPKGILLDTANTIQLAEGHLGKARDAADNPKIAGEINTEHNFLKGFFAQLTEAQSIADEGLFIKACAELKTKATVLPSVTEQIKKIASYTNTPNMASVYMEQAISYIVLAEGIFAKLP